MNQQRLFRLITALVFLAVIVAPLYPFGAAGPGTAAAEARLTLSKRSANPGESIVATGRRFPEQTAGALIWGADGSTLATFETTRTGSFTATFTVPNAPGGSYDVRATVGDATASATLDVVSPPPPTQAPEPTATEPPPPPTKAPEPAATEPPKPEPTKKSKRRKSTPVTNDTQSVSASEVLPPYTYRPTADAWVEQQAPSRNYGTDTELITDRSPLRESLLKFSVSGVSGTFQSAKLRVYVHGPSVSGPEVYGTATDWSENTVTWNSRPQRTTSRLAVHQGATGDEVWIEFDVSAHVKGNGTFSFVLVPTSGDNVEIYSREGTRPPELVLTLGSGSAVAPAPTATATATATAGTSVTPTAQPTATAPAPPPLPAGAIVVAPQADALVKQDNPTSNYGRITTLVSDHSPVVESFLRFQVSGTGGGVTKAILRLYATNGTTVPTQIYGAAPNWEETSLTWSNRPGRVTGIVGELAKVPVNAWVDYDITALVAGDGTVNLVIVNTHSDGVVFSSREGAAPPQLIVIPGTSQATATPATTPTATPTATPASSPSPTATNTPGASPSPTATGTPAGSPTPTATGTPAGVTVTITSPTSGTTLTTAQTVTIKVEITGATTVSKVEFYDNDTLAGTEDTAPFAYSWSVTSAANGKHRWVAKAYNGTTLLGTSAPVEVTVNISSSTPTAGGTVTAAGETAPVPHSGDAADDPAIWIHPTNPALSTVIGTDKLGGLAVYDLSGNQIAYYAGVQPNNVDLRYNFLLGGSRVTVVAVSDRATDSIRLYRVDPSSRGLTEVTARTLSTGIGVAGLCMYVSPVTGKYYVFIGDNSGTNQQWELFDNGGRIDAKKVRTISIGSTTEGCVADDGTGALYIAEEDVAIWRYGAEPDAGSGRAQVDAVGGGHLTADIEGLAIYYGGSGYLLASSQGSNEFAVYTRSGNAYVGKFKVEAGQVDAVTYTDGIDVTNVNLGGAYSSGLFVAQDNTNDGGNQNFKLVPWDRIAKTFSPQLAIDTSYDPRAVGAGSAPSSPPATPTPTPAPTGTPATTPTPTATPNTTPTPTPTPSPTSTTGSKTYYVDSVSGDDANSGTSPTSAWKTLSKANSASLAAGDRLLFKRGGRWAGKLSVKWSGTASNPVVIGAYGSGDLPIIEGSSGCISLTGSYVTLQELKIQNCSWSGIDVYGSNNVIQNTVITGNVAGVYVRSGASGNRILRNQIVDNNRMSVLTQGGNDDSGAFGILIRGDYTEVAYNTISGSDAFSYDYGRDGAAVEIYGGRNNHIHHNLAIDNDTFSELGNSRSADNTFAYNVVRGSLASATFLVTRGASSSYGPVLRTRLYNNTVLLTGSSSQGVICHAGCGPDILTMRNNIIQAVVKAGYADAPFDEDYNLYFGGIVQFTMGPHSLVADPKFVNGAAGDLHLQSTSPAIDRGVSAGYTQDFDGVAVPQDGNRDGKAVPDFGAYAYRG